MEHKHDAESNDGRIPRSTADASSTTATTPRHCRHDHLRYIPAPSTPRPAKDKAKVGRSVSIYLIIFCLLPRGPEYNASHSIIATPPLR